MTKALYKFPLEVSKDQETFNVFVSIRGLRVLYSLGLLWIHLDAFCGNTIVQDV